VVKAFKTLAESIAESLVKGDRLFVHGAINTDTWSDKDTGDKRAAQRVLAEVVGPSLRWATATSRPAASATSATCPSSTDSAARWWLCWSALVRFSPKKRR